MERLNHLIIEQSIYLVPSLLSYIYCVMLHFSDNGCHIYPDKRFT